MPPNLLVQELAKGNCVFFLGAGISAGTSKERAEGKGLLVGDSLTKILAEKSGYCRSEECPYYWASRKGDPCGFAAEALPPWPEQYCRASLMRVSQYFELHPELDRASLIGNLEAKLKGVSPLRTHKVLSKIALLGKMPFVITTNFDTLLEDTFRTQHVNFNLIFGDNDIAQYQAKITQIVKLHGTIGVKRDGYIITEEDYLEVSQRLQSTQSLIGNTLRHLLSTHTILFIGYSLEDQDFRTLYHDIVSTLGQYQRKAFAVQWKPKTSSCRFWERRNVRIIDQDATQFLEELLGELAITLAQDEGSQAIPVLKRILLDNELDPVIGKNVASAMAAIDSKAVAPILCQFLRNAKVGEGGDLSTRVVFVNELVRIAPERAVSILTQILYDQKIDNDGRTIAASVLGQIKVPEASKVLGDILVDQSIDPEVRSSAAEALGWIGDDTAIKTLKQVLQVPKVSDEWGVTLRSSVASALSNIGNEETCVILTEALQNLQLPLDVQVTIVIGLGRVKEEPAKTHARSVLVNMFQEPDLDTRLRRQTALALGDIGDQLVIAELESVVKSRKMEREVRTGVAATLGKIGGQKAATILGKVLQAEARYIPLEIGRREKRAELLKKVLEGKATDIAQEVLPQEKAIRQLSSVLRDHALEIARQLLHRLWQSSPSIIVIDALKERDDTYLIIDRIGEGIQLDKKISEKAIGVFDQTVSMSPIKLLKETDVDPIPMISGSLKDNARIISEAIIDDGSIADNILARVKLLDKDCYTYFMGVRDDLRKAIWQLIGSIKDELTVEVVSAKFQEEAAEIARQTAQVDRVSREVAIEAAKALGSFNDGSTRDAVESHRIAFDALKKVLENEELDKDIRSNAAKSLGRIVDVDEKAVKVLVALLEKSAIDVGIGTSIVEALSATRRDRAAEALVNLVKDKGKDFRLRRSAAFSLGKMGSEKARRILSEFAHDDEEPLKAYASDALGNLDRREELRTRYLKRGGKEMSREEKSSSGYYTSYLKRYELFSKDQRKLSSEEFDRLDDELLELLDRGDKGQKLTEDEEKKRRKLMYLLVAEE